MVGEWFNYTNDVASSLLAALFVRAVHQKVYPFFCMCIYYIYIYNVVINALLDHSELTPTNPTPLILGTTHHTGPIIPVQI